MTRALLAVAAGLTLSATAWCATLTIWSAVLRYTLDDRALAVLATALLLPTLGLGALTLTLYRKAHAMPTNPGEPAYRADALARKLDADLMAASAVDNASRPDDPTDDAGWEHDDSVGLHELFVAAEADKYGGNSDANVTVECSCSARLVEATDERVEIAFTELERLLAEHRREQGL